jgi:hypothetical protein
VWYFRFTTVLKLPSALKATGKMSSLIY